MSNKQKYSEAFDRKLIAFQKCALMLLLHPLMNAFSTFLLIMPSSNTAISSPLRLGYSHFLEVLYPDTPLWLKIIIAVAVLGIIVTTCIFGTKGKLWAYEIGLALYTADIAFIIIVLAHGGEVLGPILMIVAHLAFIATGVLTNIFYFQAKKLLPK